MSDFNISEFIKIMQEGLAENNTQEFAGRLLLESVTQQEGVCVDVNSKMISNIVNQKSEVPYAIKKASSRQEVIDEAIEYFNTTVIPALIQHTQYNTYHKLISLLNSDTDTAPETRDKLIKLHSDEKFGEFLARSFLYAINLPNKSISNSNKNQSITLARDNDDFVIRRSTNKNSNSIASSIFKKHTPAKKFVNREKPRQIFYDIINSKVENNANTIMYHGIGGIGKSSLVKNLKAYLSEHGIGYSSIDFDDPALRSSYSAMCELEKSFKVDFPHFEIAASIYFLKRNPDSIYRDTGFPFKITKILAEFIRDINYNSHELSGGVNCLYNKYKDRWQLCSSAKNELEQLEVLPSDEIEKQLVRFFALDLHDHLEAQGCGKYVVFFDTYELLWTNGQNDSNKLSVDAWVRQLTSYLDKVIFVISGREELLWYLDKEYQQDKLIMVPLEMLSSEYARKFLESCQITNIELQDAIITSSQGYPYYLDLCVDTYHKLANANKPINVELFNGGFQEIQECFFKSLTAAERESLKVLSIPRFYDIEIFGYLTGYFSTGYPVSSINNFNLFSFVKSGENGKNIVHALMRDEISKQLPTDLKTEIHKSMLSFYEQKVIDDELGMDILRYYFTELVFHLKNSYSSADAISFVESNYLPLVKRFQSAGETKYLLENFEVLFNQNKTDIVGTEFFAVMVDMIHLSGRYYDAVELINGYLSNFSIKEIASDEYRLNLFIRKIHHQMFFVSTENLQCEVNEIIDLIDESLFPEQYCEILFMLGAHILLPAGNYTDACMHLKNMMQVSSKNNYLKLLCRGLRKYAELLCAQGNFSIAEKICLDGLSIAKQHGLSRYGFYLQCVMGEILRLTGHLEEAISIFNEAKPISIAMGITGWIAHVELSIGNCQVDANDFEAGLSSYNDAKNLYCSINQVWGRINSDIAIQRTRLLMGEKVEEEAMLKLNQETQKFGYKVLTQQIRGISSGNLNKNQFLYL
ncbi:MAG: ATP-binding protein [Christensenellaceae bacterium]